MKPAIFNEVEALLIDALAGGTLDGVSTVDMHYAVYNPDNIYVYKQDAVRDLEQIGTFLAIGAVMEYEQSNFGHTSPARQYCNPCWVADMLVYILGEALIYHVFSDDPDWQNDSTITPELATKYAEMLDKALAETPDLIAVLWNRI